MCGIKPEDLPLWEMRLLQYTLIYDVNNASIMEEEPTSRSCIQHRKENDDIKTGATVYCVLDNEEFIEDW